mmetsp:Transcript_158892/g.289666  ORF Transcript_158892/g.289666 Transcript_158892/m.289666 type:complete len:483 (+) Transcript_158892:141-1589(+)
MTADAYIDLTDTESRGGTGTLLQLTEGTSLRGTIFNLLNTMIGAGVLGLPHAVQDNGIVLGGLLLAIVAGLTDVCSWMLLISMDVTRELSYARVAEKLYGRWLGVCVDVAVFLNNFGLLISYIVVIGDLVPPFMELVQAPDILQKRRTLVPAIALCMLLPLSCLPSMGALRHASLVCLGMIFLFSLIIIAMGTGLIDVSQPSDAGVLLATGNFQDILSQMAVMLFAYNCLMNVPILYGELRRKSRRMVDSRFTTKRSKMMCALHISLVLCAVVYISVGLFGYVAFRDRTKNDILTNLHKDIFSPAPYVKAAYSLVIICSYPVMCFSCVASLHYLLQQLFGSCETGPLSARFFKGDDSQLWSPQSQAQIDVPSLSTELSKNQDMSELPTATPQGTVRIVEVACVVAASLVIGLAVPDISIVFSLTGGICGGSLVFTFPGLIFLKLPGGVGRNCRLCLGHGAFWTGVVVSIATTIISFQNLISG